MSVSSNQVDFPPNKNLPMKYLEKIDDINIINQHLANLNGFMTKHIQGPRGNFFTSHFLVNPPPGPQGHQIPEKTQGLLVQNPLPYSCSEAPSLIFDIDIYKFYKTRNFIEFLSAGVLRTTH